MDFHPRRPSEWNVLHFKSPSPRPVPHLTEIHPSKLEVSLLDRFAVSFGVEGGSISLVCSMVVVPNLPNLPPLAQWFRDGKTSLI